nr:MAG TPA: hypothetical protein [Ackermannviridae sp.]
MTCRTRSPGIKLSLRSLYVSPSCRRTKKR